MLLPVFGCNGTGAEAEGESGVSRGVAGFVPSNVDPPLPASIQHVPPPPPHRSIMELVPSSTLATLPYGILCKIINQEDSLRMLCLYVLACLGDPILFKHAARRLHLDVELSRPEDVMKVLARIVSLVSADCACSLGGCVLRVSSVVVFGQVRARSTSFAPSRCPPKSMLPYFRKMRHLHIARLPCSTLLGNFYGWTMAPQVQTGLELTVTWDDETLQVAQASESAFWAPFLLTTLQPSHYTRRGSIYRESSHACLSGGF